MTVCSVMPRIQQFRWIQSQKQDSLYCGCMNACWLLLNCIRQDLTFSVPNHYIQTHLEWYLSYSSAPFLTLSQT